MYLLLPVPATTAPFRSCLYSLLTLALAGCSLAMSWDSENQLCDVRGRCLEGFSCGQDGRCHASAPLGHAGDTADAGDSPTGAGGVDATAPTVQMTTPGTTLAATVTLSATATDDVGDTR